MNDICFNFDVIQSMIIPICHQIISMYSLAIKLSLYLLTRKLCISFDGD